LWFDFTERALTWAAAKTPLFIVEPALDRSSSAKIEHINGERMGVGYRTTPMRHTWVNHTRQLNPGTSVFITTDGIIDQPGGIKRIAFGKKKLKNILVDHHTLPLKEQGERIMQAFRAYQATQIRRDDVTFFGFRP
jgi:serine phosphatase RsbU (regulator of sigma subunit)